MKYFILKPKAKAKRDIFAQASQEAMLKYAEVIENTDLELAQKLIAWSQRECINQERIKA